MAEDLRGEIDHQVLPDVHRRRQVDVDVRAAAADGDRRPGRGFAGKGPGINRPAQQQQRGQQGNHFFHQLTLLIQA